MTCFISMNSLAQLAPHSEFLTVGQVASILLVSVDQVKEWAAAGAFARFYITRPGLEGIDGQLLIHQQDIVDILLAALYIKLDKIKF